MSRRSKREERRRKREEAEDDIPREPLLHPDTKKTILGIFLVALAILLLLSSFEKAGPAGSYIYWTFDSLLGLGYYLLPLVCLVASLVLFVSERQRILATTTVGGMMLVLSGLGIMDIVSPKSGGLLGSLVGLIQVPFGYTAALVLASATLAASTIATLNTKVKITNPFAKKTHPDLVAKNGELTKTEEHNVETASAETRPEESTQNKDGDKKNNYEEENDNKKQDEELLIAEPAPITQKRRSAAPKIINYVPPPLSLLKSSTEKPTSGDLRANANIIKRTLESFGIPVEMSEINIGPKVTRYTLKPAEGVKLAKILALNQDLALALAAHPIRIEAPIPGRSLVGIEVPNKAAAIVRLGSLMIYPEFASSGDLGFVLGRDVTGTPIFSDITKMPHLLIAGATGSGKSVALHSLIISLLYKNSPSMLKFAMIDPKRVELTTYKEIPHLIAPVVTEGKKAVNVFRWAISEMERRYETLQHAGNRDIKSYNSNHKDEPLPYIVVVIDELADLMASYGREVESSIVRLAQMARATGIHLIVATQRPSVEVITGLIKANITSRMALQVASQVDSRTILDASGAEKLLGGGDMLFVSAELSKPKRIQGAFVSEEEITSVAKFIRENNAVTEEEKDGENPLDETTLEQAKNIFDQIDGDSGDDDDLLEEAVAVVREAKKASASLLQRRIKVGYARAARLLDIMESRGIIGPGDGAKPRDVYLND